MDDPRLLVDTASTASPNARVPFPVPMNSNPVRAAVAATTLTVASRAYHRVEPPDAQHEEATAGR
jgi:hypothetical protein